MKNFVYYNPTKVHFGVGVTEKLGEVAFAYGKRILLVYGKGSIIKNGIYNKVKSALSEHTFDIIEFSGIKPNPLAQDVDTAIQLAAEKKVDVIIAVGGGSVIDSAKIISLGIPHQLKAWDIITRKSKPFSAIPLIAVLTLAATGSEMNQFAVLQNHDTGEKLGYGNPLCFPRHAFLDPLFTLSVPSQHTAYGISDLIAHCLEAWFGDGDSPLADAFGAAIIREAFDFAPKLMSDLSNYDLRSRMMFAATQALNGITFQGKTSGDWGVHSLGHVISLLYDVPHGATLSIVYPAWFRLMKDRIPHRISHLGKSLYGIDSVEDTISLLESFFFETGCPVRLSQINLHNECHQKIIDFWQKNKAEGMVYRLDKADYHTLISFME